MNHIKFITVNFRQEVGSINGNMTMLPRTGESVTMIVANGTRRQKYVVREVEHMIVDNSHDQAVVVWVEFVREF